MKILFESYMTKRAKLYEEFFATPKIYLDSCMWMSKAVEMSDVNRAQSLLRSVVTIKLIIFYTYDADDWLMGVI